MMRVNPAQEPASFDQKVRQPGQAWILQKGWVGPGLPRNAKVKAFWTEALDDMMSAYSRICAYASLRIAPITGARSVDHFAPKSRALADIYEWSNYRLACSLLNGRKRDFTNLADPFTLPVGAFVLDPLSGALSPGPDMTGAPLLVLLETRQRLRLDEGEFRKARLELIDAYLNGHISAARLAVESPFISSELNRLGVYPPP